MPSALFALPSQQKPRPTISTAYVNTAFAKSVPSGALRFRELHHRYSEVDKLVHEAETFYLKIGLNFYRIPIAIRTLLASQQQRPELHACAAAFGVNEWAGDAGLPDVMQALAMLREQRDDAETTLCSAHTRYYPSESFEMSDELDNVEAYLDAAAVLYQDLETELATLHEAVVVYLQAARYRAEVQGQGYVDGALPTYETDVSDALALRRWVLALPEARYRVKVLGHIAETVYQDLIGNGNGLNPADTGAQTPRQLRRSAEKYFGENVTQSTSMLTKVDLEPQTWFTTKLHFCLGGELLQELTVLGSKPLQSPGNPFADHGSKDNPIDLGSPEVPAQSNGDNTDQMEVTNQAFEFPEYSDFSSMSSSGSTALSSHPNSLLVDNTATGSMSTSPLLDTGTNYVTPSETPAELLNFEDMALDIPEGSQAHEELYSTTPPRNLQAAGTQSVFGDVEYFGARHVLEEDDTAVVRPQADFYDTDDGDVSWLGQ